MSRHPSHSWYPYLNNIWQGAQITEFLITKLPSSRYVLPLRSKYLPHNPTLEHSSFVPPSMWHTVSHPCKTTGKITVLYIFIFIFVVSKWEDKGFWTEWQ
jgi:hypothetical protein